MFYPGRGGTTDFVANWLLDLIHDPDGHQVQRCRLEADHGTAGRRLVPRGTPRWRRSSTGLAAAQSEAACTGGLVDAAG